MTADQWLASIQKAVATLPIAGDEVFERLWKKKLLRCGVEDPNELNLNAVSAALVCAAIDGKEQLLVILPDRHVTRPALLLATGLIIDATDSIEMRRPARRVLYVGSTIGIREQLASVYAGNLRLSDVFVQNRVSDKSAPSDADSPVAAHLPHLVTAYEPADPAALLDTYKPAWVAVDCGDSYELKCLGSLLSNARKSRTPVVAWGQNPLADTIRTFAAHHAQIFQWPPMQHFEACLKGTDTLNARMGAVSLAGPEAEAVGEHLQLAFRALSAISSSRPAGRMEQDALSVAWRQLRLLEGLSLPLPLYEAEARSYWGLRTVRHGRETLEAFVRELRRADAGIASLLDQTCRHLHNATEAIDRHGPPHWHALAELCITDVESGAARILLFTNKSLRNLFELALLAFYDVTLEDLATLGITVVSAGEFYGRGRRAWIGDPSRMDAPEILRDVSPDKWQLVVPGLPSPRLLAFLEPAFRAGSQVDFLVYSHQLSSLSWRVDQCIESLSVRADETSRTLTALGAELDSVILDVSSAVLKGASTSMRPEKKSDVSPRFRPSPISHLDLDPVAEAARLFSDNDNEDVNERSALFGSEEQQDMKEDDASLFVDEALELVFEEGWHGLFAQDGVMNVLVQVHSGYEIQLRYVRSLKPGDIVLFIHGQRRQNLYDLIIQRIHNHPAFAVHLELIRHWQNDVVAAYRRWCRQGDAMRGAIELHQALRSRGSKIKNWHSVAQWVEGQRFRTRDPEDMLRLADILDMDFVRRNYRHIHDAGGRIHGMHIQLGKMLTGWLIHNAETQFAGGLLDDDLGLSFDDLRSSLLRLRVRTVRTIHGTFYREHLGNVERQ